MPIISYHKPQQVVMNDLFARASAARACQQTDQSCSPFHHSNAAAFRDHTVAETANSFQLSVDLPGVKVSDLSLKFDEGVLKISGNRKFGGQGQNSSFLKSFAMDETSMDTANASANLSDGVLIVTVPKRAKPISQIINVSSNPHEDWVAVDSTTKVEVKGEGEEKN